MWQCSYICSLHSACEQHEPLAIERDAASALGSARLAGFVSSSVQQLYTWARGEKSGNKCIVLTIHTIQDTKMQYFLTKYVILLGFAG